MVPLWILCCMSFLGFYLSFRLIPSFGEAFIKAGIYGIDLSKRDGRKIPEGTGVITGSIFLIITFLMIPFAFGEDLTNVVGETAPPGKDGRHLIHLIELLAALLSISCMLLLGFADDVLDLKWRHKLGLPSVASLPLLVVYYLTENRTCVVVPAFLRNTPPFINSEVLDLGFIYYIYMGLLAVFCTNAINILAGINGLEVGQSLVIASSVAYFNWIESDGPLGETHRFSLYFLLPFIGTSSALLYYNRYPARAFCGDTFCYFSGMTLAVVAILGHFSKTLLLFFIPQIVNFLYSCPQLFRFIPCPRHRLPKYDPESDRLFYSTTTFNEKDLNKIGKLLYKILCTFKLASVTVDEKDGSVVMNNLTLINFVLRLIGPMHERNLVFVLLSIQILCSVIAFFIRYPLALLLYGEIVA